jgi:RND superfamily putative drug exporter
MLLVPSVMHLLGRANWWLPEWLGRLLPQLHIEGRPEVFLPAQRTIELERVAAGKTG